MAPKKNQAKVKARKQAHEASKQEEETPPTVKYTFTTKDLLEQAQIVAGRAEVSGGLQKVLERAIQARQRCAEWFQASKVENEYSNEGHQHFIGVLEQTLEIIGKRERTTLQASENAKGKGKGKERPSESQSDASWQEPATRFLKSTSPKFRRIASMLPTNWKRNPKKRG